MVESNGKLYLHNDTNSFEWLKERNQLQLWSIFHLKKYKVLVLFLFVVWSSRSWNYYFVCLDEFRCLLEEKKRPWSIGQKVERCNQALARRQISPRRAHGCFLFTFPPLVFFFLWMRNEPLNHWYKYSTIVWINSLIKCRDTSSVALQ